MHFHFPLPATRQGTAGVHFFPRRHLVGDGPAAGCGTSGTPNPEVKAWGRPGGFWSRFGSGRSFAGWVQAVRAIPHSPRSDPRLQTWADADEDLEKIPCLRPAPVPVPSGGSLGLHKLGNQSKNRCFSKSLFFSSVFLPYRASR